MTGMSLTLYTKVGKDVELSMNPSLRCPPPMPGSAVLYDTVRGITGGSTVYMVYETLSRAYPGGCV
jgi:hypothetical protein